MDIEKGRERYGSTNRHFNRVTYKGCMIQTEKLGTKWISTIAYDQIFMFKQVSGEFNTEDYALQAAKKMIDNRA
jgi:hypothetical protein